MENLLKKNITKSLVELAEIKTLPTSKITPNTKYEMHNKALSLKIKTINTKRMSVIKTHYGHNISHLNFTAPIENKLLSQAQG